MVTSLSDYEMQLVTNAEVLLTKNKIIQKIIALFGVLSLDYKNILQAGSIFMANEIAPKISRGENYNGLPYVILDYPRHFSKTDVFAIRTFFWWGNFFSITLQLEGVYQHQYASSIQKAIDKNLFQDWSVGCANNPWQHHFEEENYTSIQQGRNYYLADLPHVKIAKKIPLYKWDEAEAFFKENFTYLIKTLGS